MLRSCFLSRLVEFRSAVSEEKSIMSQPIRSQGGHLVFPMIPKKKQTWQRTLGSYFLLSFVEFRSVISEKSKMSQPIRGQGDHLVVPIGHKLGRRHWDLASYEVSLNSVQLFQSRSRKCETLMTTDRWRKDDGDGQGMITIVHLSLRLRSLKSIKPRNLIHRRRTIKGRHL